MIVEPLAASAVLTAWERGRSQGPTDRALTLLELSVPAATRDALSDLTVGRRDALLLELRARCFGSVAPCVVRCPSCDETLELSIPLRDLRVAPPDATETTLHIEGRAVRVRAVTSRDLLAVDALTDPKAAAAALLARCAKVDDADPTETSSLRPDMIDAVTAEMARLDPQADVRLDLSCAACGDTWTSLFDVGAYLWHEVETEAQRLFLEVGQLARMFAWSEREILAMSAARRQAYLRLIEPR
ncbi:MAG: hypothetical protein R3B70_08895 [Polyangiaceae bacterium]